MDVTPNDTKTINKYKFAIFFCNLLGKTTSHSGTIGGVTDSRKSAAAAKELQTTRAMEIARPVPEAAEDTIKASEYSVFDAQARPPRERRSVCTFNLTLTLVS